MSKSNGHFARLNEARKLGLDPKWGHNKTKKGRQSE